MRVRASRACWLAPRCVFSCAVCAARTAELILAPASVGWGEDGVAGQATRTGVDCCANGPPRAQDASAAAVTWSAQSRTVSSRVVCSVQGPEGVGGFGKAPFRRGRGEVGPAVIWLWEWGAPGLGGTLWRCAEDDAHARAWGLVIRVPRAIVARQ